ncbi:hypothetical protein [Brevundimonas sp. CEF1]|uniref:hypothetical protein n=1 Tax=Brevundimonas sp. CEF1 TaxID=3442642 RepID=UPI003F50E619
MRLSLLGLVLLTTACGPSNPAPRDSELRQTPAPTPAWTMHSITLYLPTPVIEQRVPTAVLGDYIKDLRARASNAFMELPAQEGVSGAVVVMVKPGRQARVWLATGAPMEPEMQAAIEKALAEAPPPEVVGGPVVFGLLFSAWGGGTPPAGLPMPTPEAWNALSGDAGDWVMDDRFYEEAWGLR